MGQGSRGGRELLGPCGLVLNLSPSPFLTRTQKTLKKTTRRKNKMELQVFTARPQGAHCSPGPAVLQGLPQELGWEGPRSSFLP